MVFDGQEMELLRDQLHHLSGFDPRRSGVAKRQKTVEMLGNGDGKTMALTEEDVLLEAGAMGAYALAQTAIGDPDRRNRLIEAFNNLIDQQTDISNDYKKTLIDSRKKVDKLYEATREQLDKSLPGN